MDGNSDTTWSVQPIVDWLFDEGRRITDQTHFVQAFAECLVANQVPVDGLRIVVRTLNPVVVALGHIWFRDSNETITMSRPYSIMQSSMYIGSPLQPMIEEGQSIRQRLDQLPDDAHGAFTDLAEAGFTDYIGIPIPDDENIMLAAIFSTRQVGGFSQQDIDQLHQLCNMLAPLLEMHRMRHTATSVLNTYVGPRTGEKILDGMIRRGESEIIHAAIWFSDLRDFTHYTESLRPQQIIDLMNIYFEKVAVAVTERGGEILRFIGDAMLIVFPTDENVEPAAACQAAYEAALAGQTALEKVNTDPLWKDQPPIEFGVGLTLGEVVYGNVGAPDRLDFTVMGPAVNRSARLEALTKSLDRPVLCSLEFADALSVDCEYLGDFEMKGIRQPQPVYAPPGNIPS